MLRYVVDVERGTAAVGGELQADEEALLLEMGSRQDDLWGALPCRDLSLPAPIHARRLEADSSASGLTVPKIDTHFDLKYRFRQLCAHRVAGPC
jgi:hypothetical protein